MAAIIYRTSYKLTNDIIMYIDAKSSHFVFTQIQNFLHQMIPNAPKYEYVFFNFVKKYCLKFCLKILRKILFEKYGLKYCFKKYCFKNINVSKISILIAVCMYKKKYI